MIGAIVGVCSIVASGPVADRVGRRTLLAVTAGAIAAFSGFAPELLDGGDVGQSVYMIVGFVLLGLSFGQASGSVATSFSRIYRYTGSGSDLGSRMAVRCRLRALLGALALEPVRPLVVRRLSPVRRHLPRW
ncbi:MAG: hypothetical protein WDN69_01495 [Aliidongia sp.]